VEVFGDSAVIGWVKPTGSGTNRGLSLGSPGLVPCVRRRLLATPSHRRSRSIGVTGSTGVPPIPIAVVGGGRADCHAQQQAPLDPHLDLLAIV
jgi:hypothetical protein